MVALVIISLSNFILVTNGIKLISFWGENITKCQAVNFPVMWVGKLGRYF